MARCFLNALSDPHVGSFCDNLGNGWPLYGGRLQRYCVCVCVCWGKGGGDLLGHPSEDIIR